jgi:hypothetical protein
LGVSPPLANLELLGVVLFTVCRRPSIVLGTEISEGVIASAQGLFELSSATIALRALLSLLLSRILRDSPLTCCDLAKPELLEPEFDSPVVVDGAVEATLDVSIVSARFGDLPRPPTSSSTQPAGVGGTGPKLDPEPKLELSPGGRLVGGETIRSDPDTLCDRDWEGGGGTGGGGGSGIPGAHLAVDEPRERDDEGVLIAPADAARREAGA